MAIKMSENKRKMLLEALKEAEAIKAQINAVTKDESVKSDVDRGGVPSEVNGYENLTYKQVIEKSLNFSGIVKPINDKKGLNSPLSILFIASLIFRIRSSASAGLSHPLSNSLFR